MLAMTALGVMLTVSAAATASAFPGRDHGRAGGPHGDPAARIEQRLAELDLDDETRAAVFEILDGSRGTARELRADLRASHEELAALLAEDRPATSAVLAQADAVGARITALRKQHLSTMLAVRALLSPEQVEDVHTKLTIVPRLGLVVITTIFVLMMAAVRG